MDNDLKDILSNSNKDIDNQRLMDYLTQQLSKTDNHEVEKNMAADEFLNDAVEGLQKIDNKRSVQDYVDQLNIDLQKQTAKNKKRKEKRRLKDQPYTYLTIILILLLLVISFLVLKRYLDTRKSSSPEIPAATTTIPVRK